MSIIKWKVEFFDFGQLKSKNSTVGNYANEVIQHFIFDMTVVIQPTSGLREIIIHS